MTLHDVLGRLEKVKPISGGHMARCPVHDDSTASLSVTEGKDGRILLHCHANCATPNIVAALSLTMGDLFPEDRDRGGMGDPLAVYEYRDERGVLLYQALRFPAAVDGKKTFRQRHPDGAGGWIWKMDGVRRVIYHLDKIQRREVIAVVEGEKDADRLWALGLPATTNSGGAGKWRDELTAQLVEAGVKRVVIFPDNDPPGEAHSLLVARSCADAGIFVKRILLPDLPEKGDVSDWLDQGHPKADLLAIIKHAPPFQAHASVVIKPKLELTSLADLLDEPDEAVEWVVEDRIPGGSLILLAGKPKAGKSTLARTLAFCVAAGEPWLGAHVTHGPVWYLALEDKRSEVRGHFRRMGATGREPLWVLVGEAPADCIRLLEDRARQEQPVLIIVDTLQRLIQAKDMSDYAEVTTKFSPLLKLCRETGAACVVVHHANKYGEGLDSILGSTALSGSVDNIFIMGRGEHERTLQSIQRIGDDLEATVVTHDHETGHMALAGSKRDAEIQRVAEMILEALRSEADAQTERWIREQVEAAPKSQASALRMALRRNWVYRLGEGKRGNPYVYGVIPTDLETRKTSKTTNGSGKPEYVLANTGVSAEKEAKTGSVFAEHGQKLPCTKPENQKPLSSTTVRTYRSQEITNQVLLVSSIGGNGNGNGSHRHVTHSLDTTYSGFASPDSDQEIDDSLFANAEDDFEDQP